MHTIRYKILRYIEARYIERIRWNNGVIITEIVGRARYKTGTKRRVVKFLTNDIKECLPILAKRISINGIRKQYVIIDYSIGQGEMT